MAANLFAAAKKEKPSTKSAPKKGTVFTLPKNLDANGKLEGESAVLNEAVSNLIEADKDKKKADANLKIAKGQLNPWIETVYCMEWAKYGIQPPTPVSVVNHLGQTNTFVLMDKTQQYTLKDDQVEIIGALLGPEGAEKLIESVDVYSFDSNTMKQEAAGEGVENGQTVQDIVFEAVSEAVMGDARLSDEQKASLVNCDSVTRVKAGHLPRLAELVGADAGKIQEVLQAIGSGATHFLKA